ncbi:MAG: 4Fe-4S dicluster domain-containing protein [Deltaproteobacteria bacterium]|nr:MAG: 4Fe-4S dicluster domain-containing protein [Deltaproteobacteria bacterium]
MNRRQALYTLVGGALSAGCAATGRPAGASSPEGTLLPPTAGPRDRFLSRCIRCYRCGEVCTAGCIEFHPPWASPTVAGTPYIVPRRAGCNTCMRCTQVCPTGALTPVEAERSAVLDQVRMGLAYVDEGLCLSHLGRICGVCHDACPYSGDAIVLGPGARPEVLDACVGCGRCEERCPQVPAAIRVFRDEPGPRWSGPPWSPRIEGEAT